MTKAERKSEVDPDRVRDAWAAWGALKKPEDVESVAWASMMFVLHRLARYAKYEVIRPTQQHLADEMGLSRTSVQTRLDLAERLELIKRTQVLEGGKWSFTSYELLFDRARSPVRDRARSPGVDRARSPGTNTLPLTEEEEKTGDFVSTKQRISASGRNEVHEQGVTVTPGGRNADEILADPAFGERASKRVTKRPKKASANISRRTADYFAEKWEGVVYERPAFHDYRCMDSLGQAVSYFDATFFRPSAGRVYTEEVVRVMIDDFMLSVLSHRTRIKPNQSVLMRFTGWWGRGKKVRAVVTQNDYDEWMSS